jgi:Sarcosine oxidase gamma subunit
MTLAPRVSPLDGLPEPRALGRVGEAGPGVRLSTRTDLALTQVAAWPETAGAVARALAGAVGAEAPPPPGRVATGPRGDLVRIGPLKWWMIDAAPAPAFAPEEAATLDLSHEQTPIRVEGRDAAALARAHRRRRPARGGRSRSAPSPPPEAITPC